MGIPAITLASTTTPLIETTSRTTAIAASHDHGQHHRSFVVAVVNVHAKVNVKVNVNVNVNFVLGCRRRKKKSQSSFVTDTATMITVTVTVRHRRRHRRRQCLTVVRSFLRSFLPSSRKSVTTAIHIRGPYPFYKTLF